MEGKANEGCLKSVGDPKIKWNCVSACGRIISFNMQQNGIERNTTMYHKSLILAVDMYGCPNRCKHCWIGHMPNKQMDKDEDVWIVDYFKPFFNKITYYSWLREPDFCDDYRERWNKDIQISVNSKPERFELASFWRLVRDPDYVFFLKEVGVKRVQLTYFGMEEMTDKYVGRKGAFQELLKATDILIDNQIAPRWQVFINEENKDQIIQLLDLTNTLQLKERCASFGEKFEFFVHSGSCDGENRRLYDIRIKKDHIPVKIRPYYLNYNKAVTEQECCELLKEDTSHVIYHNKEQIVLYVSNTFDVYFNFTHMTEVWNIGNLKDTEPEEMIRKIIEEDTDALNAAKTITIKTLVERYGNMRSKRIFFIEDYKTYLLNCFLEESGKWV